MPTLYKQICFNLKKQGNPCQHKSYWEPGSRDPPLFASLILTIICISASIVITFASACLITV